MVDEGVVANQNGGSSPAQQTLRNHFAGSELPRSTAADLVRLVHGVLPAPRPGDSDVTPATPDAETILSALRMLRELREELAGWEPRLIDAARTLGVSWNDLAPALGVASRQAAERRYLRLRPARADEAGSTRDERVRNERDRRAEDRAVVEWARRHAGALRRIAARVADLHDQPELDESARESVDQVHRTLGGDDTAELLSPLRDARDALGPSHPALAQSISDVLDRTDALRDHTRQRRADTRG
ncbi:hypothetical protein [Cryptosporangium minutisporangium]|uniref:DUF3156 family protein n=2 Tax=Cryptosporangium minutisporangium TaxID=113569 RepID=A0ABP6SR81_9ACTN